MTSFTLGTVTVQFDRDPARPGGLTPSVRQIRERDSLGVSRVYTKGTKRLNTHRLTFTGYSALGDSTLAELRSFLRNTALGVRKTFTWTDAQGTDRTVRFVQATIDSNPIASGRNEVTILLEEEI